MDKWDMDVRALLDRFRFLPGLARRTT